MTDKQKQQVRARLDLILAALDGDCCAFAVTLSRMGPFLEVGVSFGEIVGDAERDALANALAESAEGIGVVMRPPRPANN